LIESYIGLSRVKEALAVAKEAIQLMPKNPKMLTLVGVVLSHTPNGREKAKKAFENALAIDPYCTEAAIALVSTNIAKKEWKSSIQM
jgi:cytochrome c-type biogenesis protein CcmH/NrfG